MKTWRKRQHLERNGDAVTWLTRYRRWAIAIGLIALCLAVYLKTLPPRVRFVGFREHYGTRGALFEFENNSVFTYSYEPPETVYPALQIQRSDRWELKPEDTTRLPLFLNNHTVRPGERFSHFVPLRCADASLITTRFRVGIAFHRMPLALYYRLSRRLPAGWLDPKREVSWSADVTP